MPGPEPKLSEIRRLGRYIGKAPEFETLREAREYMECIYKGFGDLGRERWKQVARYSVKRVDDVYVMHYDPKIGEAYRASYSYYGYNMWGYWRRIGCPTLILRGEHSKFLSAVTVESMLRRGVDAQSVTVPNAGHAPMLVTCDELQAIYGFVSSVESGVHPRVSED